jgi:hypothetical protein
MLGNPHRRDVHFGHPPSVESFIGLKKRVSGADSSFEVCGQPIP